MLKADTGQYRKSCEEKLTFLFVLVNVRPRQAGVMRRGALTGCLAGNNTETPLALCAALS